MVLPLGVCDNDRSIYLETQFTEIFKKHPLLGYIPVVVQQAQF